MNAYTGFTAPIRAEIIRLTPEKARELLESSRGNRAIRQKHITYLAKQISEGKWKLNGEGLIMDRENSLIDGHHRCHAVIKAGDAIETLVVRNVDSSAFSTINTGAVRSPADVLTISGATSANANLAAATARCTLAYKSLPDGATCEAYNAVRFDNEAIKREVRAWGDAIDFVHLVASTKGGALRRAGTVAAAMVLAARDLDKGNAWLSGVLKGENLSSTDPRYVYRERLFSGASRRPTEIFVFAMKSARAFFQGQEMKLLRFNSGEVFPRLPEQAPQ